MIKPTKTELNDVYGRMQACRNLLNLQDDDEVFFEIKKLLEFVRQVARSECLDQIMGSKCHCFSCEAKRLIARQGPDSLP